MALLNKHQFLAKDDFEYKDVYIKELDGEIRIRALSVEDQLSFEQNAPNLEDGSELMFSLILKCCVDKDNNLLFEESDLKDIKKKSANVIITLFQEILKINQLSQDEVDTLAKN